MNTPKIIKRIFFTIAICLAGLSISNLNVSAANKKANIETRLFEKVENAVANGRILEIKADIQRVLRLNPRNTGALFYAGLYSYESKNIENAKKFFKRLENDLVYGAKSRNYLAEIRFNQYKNNFKETMNILVSGESYEAALKLCEKAISEIPNNESILFTAAYSAAILGLPAKARLYTSNFNKIAKNKSEGAELTAFVDAWFAETYEEEDALNILLSITNRKLITTKVRKHIRDLIVKYNKIDKFEFFINREKELPDADVGALERELISFLIDQRQYERALLLVNQRPIDSIDDNMLYLRLLTLTNQERKAMSSARQLLSVYPSDLRVYAIWVEAWLQLYTENQTIPKGLDDGGKNIEEMADEILNRLKADHLVTKDPKLLLGILRIAIITDYQQQIKIIAPEAYRITFNEKLVEYLLKCINEIVTAKASHIAINLLESASNQMPDNYNLVIKMAEMNVVTNPQATVNLMTPLLQEKPQLLRAFSIKIDALCNLGEYVEAENEVIKRLDEPDISELVRRQLLSKLEIIRMYGTQDDTQTIQEGEQKKLE